MKGISVQAGCGCALLTPALLWLGLPGGGEFWPALFVGLVPLMYLTRLALLQQRFFFGLLCGLCHFMLQLYWVVIVLGRYGGLPWFFSLPAFILLSFYMALYFAVFVVLAGATQRRWQGGLNVCLIPVIWVGLDWLRAMLFSGFPWMDLGYGLWQVPILIQTADLFGHHFITFIVVLINSLLFLLLQKALGRTVITQTVVVGGGMVAIMLYGYLRMEHFKDESKSAEFATVGIVQGNIDQSRKWSAEVQQSTVATYLKHSHALGAEDNFPELIVWPETALPFFPTRNQLFERLQRFTRMNSTTLLTGSPWFEVVDYQTKDVDFFNSAFIVNPQGEFGDMYFKSHLVPFGEYVPMKRFLPFLAPLVEAVGDFTPGVVGLPLKSGNIHSGVLICFESIFPEIARKWVDQGANLLVNLTNDAWYGRSSAPSQSMAMSIYRAVETRRSLVRSANTGISAFINPLGQVKKKSEIFTIWSQSEEVELRDEITFHSRWGYLFAPLCCGSTLLLGIIIAGTATLCHKSH